MLNSSVKKLSVAAFCLALSILAVGTGIFEATKVLGLTSATAASLYYSLQVIGWGMTAASIVSTFGLSTVLTGAIVRAVSRYGFKGFVSW
ncbi:hypothetical protein VSK91_01200 [Bacillus swezeyi]|uniref:hypothetical protein n=1 Tax=Bacillus swezeyi TaxID=1925020 RepID=UPI0039C5C124